MSEDKAEAFLSWLQTAVPDVEKDEIETNLQKLKAEELRVIILNHVTKCKDFRDSVKEDLGMTGKKQRKDKGRDRSGSKGHQKLRSSLKHKVCCLR